MKGKIMKLNFTSVLLLVFVIFYLTELSFAQDSTETKQSTKIKTSDQSNQIKHGRQFVDKNGDGYNDNAPDHDGDGIPNGLDPDYLKLKQRKKGSDLPYVDLDGDGINDNLRFGKRNRYRNNNINNQNNNPQPQNSNSGQGKGSNNQNQQQGKGKGKNG